MLSHPDPKLSVTFPQVRDRSWSESDSNRRPLLPKQMALNAVLTGELSVKRPSASPKLCAHEHAVFGSPVSDLIHHLAQHGPTVYLS
jgi:hypothetical protein